MTRFSSVVAVKKMKIMVGSIITSTRAGSFSKMPSKGDQIGSISDCIMRKGELKIPEGILLKRLGTWRQ